MQADSCDLKPLISKLFQTRPGSPVPWAAPWYTSFPYSPAADHLIKLLPGAPLTDAERIVPIVTGVDPHLEKIPCPEPSQPIPHAATHLARADVFFRMLIGPQPQDEAVVGGSGEVNPFDTHLPSPAHPQPFRAPASRLHYEPEGQTSRPPLEKPQYVTGSARPL